MNQANRLFLLCSDDPILRDHLESVFNGIGQIQSVSLTEALNPNIWQQYQPQLCFFDFIVDESIPQKFEQLSQIIHVLDTEQPNTPQIALGSHEQAVSAINALRNRITEFVDPGQDDELINTVNRLLEQRLPNPFTHQKEAKHVVILGARPGVGATLFATQLAMYLQDAYNDQAKTSLNTSGFSESHKVGLLDLGWPTADSLVYLNLSSQFRLNDALSNLHRLDTTLLNTALTQAENQLSVLALPADSTAANAPSVSELKQLTTHLSHHFSVLITELDNHLDSSICAAVLEKCDEVWIVTDQSIGALVSLSDLLLDSEINAFLRPKAKLIVNKYQNSSGLSDKNIADQFQLPLLATVPDQSKTLLDLTNQGQLFKLGDKINPYLKVIDHLCYEQFALKKTNTKRSLFKRLFNK